MTEAELDRLYPEHLATLMRRADAALAATGFEALEIRAGTPPLRFLDDQDYPFKVNPHFKAWVPLEDHPGCVLLYTPGRTPTILFHQPEDYWYASPPLPEGGWTRQVELVPLRSQADADAYRRRLGRTAVIAPPESAAGTEAERLNPAALLTRLHYERAVKTPYEIACMRRATEIGVRGHLAAVEAFRAGACEFAIHHRYLEACGQREEEMPYNCIVAHNEHAATLHYQRLDRIAPRQRRSLLIDAGAQFRGYAADITRSHAAESSAYADLVDALDQAQRSLCGEVRAGRDFRDIHRLAHRAIGEVLREAGVLRISVDDAIERAVTTVFFPHGIGHLLGLQVHDVGGVLADADGHENERPPGHPYLRLTRRLEPGVVVTVEPGIYFIDSLLAAARRDQRRDAIDWERVDALRPYGGARIEDNVVTTSAAPVNLTRESFASAAA